MKKIELSLRMRAVADMVRPGGVVCDVGCDHAFVPIYLVERNISDRVIASDVRSGPVAIAKENIAKHGLPGRIDVRLGNGLAALSAGEADTVIMAGMGGLLMIDIIKSGWNVAVTAGQLVLQPQSEIEQIRRFVAECGFHISREAMVKDAGKFYVVMDVDTRRGETKNVGGVSEMPVDSRVEEAADRTNNTDLSEIYFKYGKCLIESKNAVLTEYLGNRRKALAKIADGLRDADTENARQRYAELVHEIHCIDEALLMMER